MNKIPEAVSEVIGCEQDMVFDINTVRRQMKANSQSPKIAELIDAVLDVCDSAAIDVIHHYVICIILEDSLILLKHATSAGEAKAIAVKLWLVLKAMRQFTPRVACALTQLLGEFSENNIGNFLAGSALRE